MAKLSNEAFTKKKQYSLLLEMIRTDFKLRYQESFLGYIWSLLKPLFLFAILYTVFTNVLRIGADTPNYAQSLLLAIILWSFFVEATSRSLKSIVGRGSLIRKIYIPRYLIPMSVIASAAINLFINLTIILLIVILFKNEDTAISLKTAWAIIPLIIELFIITSAVAFFLSAVFVRFRDIDHIYEVVRQALFYGTPIIYPITLIPVSYFAARKLIMVNPLAQIIQDMRYLITYDGSVTITNVFNSSFARLIPVTFSVILLALSVRFFIKRSVLFAENV